MPSRDKYLAGALLATVALLLSAACRFPLNTGSGNHAAEYRSDVVKDNLLASQLKVVDDSTVRLFLQIDADRFLYMRNASDSFTARIAVVVEVIASLEQPVIVDSAHFRVELPIAVRNSKRLITADFHRSHSGRFPIRVTITDLNKGESFATTSLFDHMTAQSRSAFIATNSDAGQPLFKDYVSSGDSLRISFSDKRVQEAWCSYYRRDFPLPFPPFSYDNRVPFNYTPDSLFPLPVNTSNTFRPTATGFYHFRIDTASREGFTLFCFDADYPKVSSTRQMVPPLRYICTKNEFEAFDTLQSMRTAIDRFWLSVANGEKERARTLIRYYYGRVEIANRLFTCHTEGWRTDRGMIYIIFGPPNIVHRYSDSEVWVYGTENSPTSLSLMFVRVENPFTDNDYSLNRSPVYEPGWYKAVDVWRHGKVFNSTY